MQACLNAADGCTDVCDQNASLLVAAGVHQQVAGQAAVLWQHHRTIQLALSHKHAHSMAGPTLTGVDTVVQDMPHGSVPGGGQHIQHAVQLRLPRTGLP